MKNLMVGFLFAALTACAAEPAEPEESSTLPLIVVTEGNERGFAGSYEPATGLVQLSTTALNESFRLVEARGMLDPFLVLEVDSTSAFEVDGRTATTTVNRSLLDAQVIQAKVFDHETRFYGLIADLHVGTEQELATTPAFVPTAVMCWAEL